MIYCSQNNQCECLLPFEIIEVNINLSMASTELFFVSKVKVTKLAPIFLWSPKGQLNQVRYYLYPYMTSFLPYKLQISAAHSRKISKNYFGLRFTIRFQISL